MGSFFAAGWILDRCSQKFSSCKLYSFYKLCGFSCVVNLLWALIEGQKIQSQFASINVMIANILCSNYDFQQNANASFKAAWPSKKSVAPTVLKPVPIKISFKLMTPVLQQRSLACIDQDNCQEDAVFTVRRFASQSLIADLGRAVCRPRVIVFAHQVFTELWLELSCLVEATPASLCILYFVFVSLEW